jgi:hypothetical protein
VTAALPGAVKAEFGNPVTRLLFGGVRLSPLEVALLRRAADLIGLVP